MIIFEYGCSCLAELSSFGNRQFYQDFWNCTDLEGISRKWNKMLHEFLYRHIYLACIKNEKMSLFQGYIATTAYSAIIYELFMFCVLKIFRLYIFILLITLATYTFLLGEILKLRKVLLYFQYFRKQFLESISIGY